MNLARDYLERLADARAGVEHRILRIADDAMVAHGGNRRILLPEITRRRIGTHRAVQNYLGPHRDDELDAEMRPPLAGGGSDIVGARDAHELVEISARANRDDRPMTDEHQRALRLDVCETLLNGGDLRPDLRDELACLVLAIYSRAHFFDAGFDFVQRVVAD